MMLETRPIIFATFGLPGSGKTYFAEKLARDYDLAHLNSDVIRARLFPLPTYSPSESSIVFKEIDRLTIRHLLSGRGVVYDANLSRLTHRAPLKLIAEMFKTPLFFIAFKTPAELARERLLARRLSYRWREDKFAYPAGNTGEDIYQIMADRLEPLRPEEPTIWLDGASDYQWQLATLQASLIG